MEACSHEHQEIVFQGVDCPMCTADDEITTLKEQVEQLETERARPMKRD